ncbi:hypothetical protein COV04_03765 [Candidatus Uhrbacteria bacterium CG10_big_fil_rev_8_21_14_0_10_48_11]|uniref:TfoX N-terminal domain-containing protein n=1 Tax=Candidatus Uhrbacteria bacterium CG10_big_fil_rev_8_21_14_0_10_48_11 TaxID=1975037 RepID=A0A2M8LE30_9BACT|nr:MAG: hypothetical protein COV04_03765 [Candidatus Uhrbacteria bacterium CG10_big_fil_rev_8_21_14_0_10_48_11]
MAAGSFKDYLIKDVLAVVEGVYARPMFGAWGLYQDGVIFGIVADERVYFKADKFTDFYFTERGSEQFSYGSKGKKVFLPYWEVPEEVLENREELLTWIERSSAVVEQGAKRQARLKAVKAEAQAAEESAVTRPTANIKGILFDCFDVVFSSSPHEAWLREQVPNFASRFAEYDTIETRGDRGDIPYGEFTARVAKAFTVNAQELENGALRSARLNTDVQKLIGLLRPRYRIGLLTNSPRVFIDRLASRFSLDSLFDVMVTSSDLHHLKPEAVVFKAATKTLGTLSDATIYIDDKEKNVRGARSAGLIGIKFEKIDQLIGDLYVSGVIF